MANRFHDRAPSVTAGDFPRVVRWAVVDRVAGRRRRSPSRAAVPVVANDATLLRANRGRPSLTWVGHASWVVQLGGATILTDPIWSHRIGPGIVRNVEPGVRSSDMPRIDAVVISHDHRDHLDAPTIARLDRDVVIVCGIGLGRFFRALGFRDVRELDWWTDTTLGDVRISFVPSKHWSRRGLFDQNDTLWGGFILDGPGARVHFAGDTAYFDGFSDIGRRHPGITHSLLPIGAYDPEWFMGPQHMNPEQAGQAAIDMGAATLCAMHWGTFKLTDEPLDEPPERLLRWWRERETAGRGMHDAPWVLAIGETRWLDEQDRRRAE